MKKETYKISFTINGTEQFVICGSLSEVKRRRKFLTQENHGPVYVTSE